MKLSFRKKWQRLTPKERITFADYVNNYSNPGHGKSLEKRRSLAFENIYSERTIQAEDEFLKIMKENKFPKHHMGGLTSIYVVLRAEEFLYEIEAIAIVQRIAHVLTRFNIRAYRN